MLIADLPKNCWLHNDYKTLNLSGSSTASILIISTSFLPISSCHPAYFLIIKQNIIISLLHHFIISQLPLKIPHFLLQCLYLLISKFNFYFLIYYFLLFIFVFQYKGYFVLDYLVKSAHDIGGKKLSKLVVISLLNIFYALLDVCEILLFNDFWSENFEKTVALGFLEELHPRVSEFF